MKIKPKVIIGKVYNPCRMHVRNLVQSKKFEIAILILIFINTCVLCIVWYSESN
jgi:hypothetical protein